MTNPAPLGGIPASLILDISLETSRWLHDVTGVWPDPTPMFGAWAGAANELEYYMPELAPRCWMTIGQDGDEYIAATFRTEDAAREFADNYSIHLDVYPVK